MAATRSFGRRLWAFLSGDMLGAEVIGINAYDYPLLEWIHAAGKHPDKATYALESTKRAADDAEAVVRRVQDKAAGLLAMTLTLFPLAMAVTLFVVPGNGQPGPWRWLAFGLFVGTDLALAMAATMAFLAGGLVRAGGLNPSKYKADMKTSLPELQAIEADAWYYATEIALEVGHRKALDLFAARRFVIGALLTAVLATPFVFLARANDTAVAPAAGQSSIVAPTTINPSQPPTKPAVPRNEFLTLSTEEWVAMGSMVTAIATAILVVVTAFYLRATRRLANIALQQEIWRRNIAAADALVECLEEIRWKTTDDTFGAPENLTPHAVRQLCRDWQKAWRRNRALVTNPEARAGAENFNELTRRGRASIGEDRGRAVEFARELASAGEPIIQLLDIVRSTPPS